MFFKDIQIIITNIALGIYSKTFPVGPRFIVAARMRNISCTGWDTKKPAARAGAAGLLIFFYCPYTGIGFFVSFVVIQGKVFVRKRPTCSPMYFLPK